MKKYLSDRIKILCIGLMCLFSSGHCLADAGNRVIFTLEIDGKKIGYQKLEWTLRNGSPHFSETMVMDVAHAKSRSVVRHEFSMWQKPGVDDIYFVKVIDAGTVKNLQEGRIHDNHVQLKNAKGVYLDTKRVLPDGIVFPAAQLQWYLGKRLTAAVPLDFQYFDPQRLAASVVNVSTCRERTGVTPEMRCWLRKYTSGPRTNDEFWLFDNKGKLLSIETGFAGIPMIKKPCVANCMDASGQAWDFIGRLIVQSPYKIPQKAAKGKINYLLSSKSGRPLSLLDSAEQSVSIVDGKSIVSVCADCTGIAEKNAPQLQDYIESNAWVQSDHPEIRRLALSAVSNQATVKTKMLQLVKLTQKKMTGMSSYVGYSTALAALRSGSGDCSEFALLLAAFARAQGIPTRIVFGMAYSSRFTGRANVFSPHAWVQVWDKDRWVSYDAALSEFDATHIALAMGSGSPEEVLEGFNQLSDIKIEQAAAIAVEP
ncbi:MAG: transglutaminase-like domain-containing protein [Arenimonas sp.]